MMILPKAPGLTRPNFEPVVVGGVAFYLDHENQLAIPIRPTVLPADSPSKAMGRLPA